MFSICPSVCACVCVHACRWRHSSTGFVVDFLVLLAYRKRILDICSNLHRLDVCPVNGISIVKNHCFSKIMLVKYVVLNYENKQNRKSNEQERHTEISLP